MIHSKTLIACMFAIVIVTADSPCPECNAAAQAPKGAQKWEYATLTYQEPVGGGVFGTLLSWRTGKKTFQADFQKDQPTPFARLYKELGGKEDTVSLGMLLDQIGQDGWELATHAMTIAPRGIPMMLQTWTFKRPVP